MTSFRESRSGDFVPDFGPESGEQLSPRLLSHALQSGAPGNVAPIVIVEGALPPSRFELSLQGIARNRYCADLFAAEGFKAVIGTGFWDDSTISASLDGLVSELSEGGSLGDLWNRSPRSSFWPAVLFTSDPGLPVWEPSNVG